MCFRPHKENKHKHLNHGGSLKYESVQGELQTKKLIYHTGIHGNISKIRMQTLQVQERLQIIKILCLLCAEVNLDPHLSLSACIFALVACVSCLIYFCSTM